MFRQFDVTEEEEERGKEWQFFLRYIFPGQEDFMKT
jgi:hypothetical protein